MTFTIHERAIELSAKALVTDLSDSEQIWLDKHMANCAACAAEVDARLATGKASCHEEAQNARDRAGPH